MLIPKVIGDLVSCYIPGHGVPASELYVIGYPAYENKGHSVVLLANDTSYGMPCSQEWLTFISSGHEKKCAELRARYIATYGKGVLEPVP